MVNTELDDQLGTVGTESNLKSVCQSKQILVDDKSAFQVCRLLLVS